MVGTAFFVGGVFFVGVTFLATGAALSDALFLDGAAFAARVGRGGDAFFAAAALLAGVITSSFPTIEAVGPLTSSAPRERVTIADVGDGGQ